MAIQRGFMGLAIASIVVVGIVFLGSVPGASAETLKSKVVLTMTTDKSIPVSDQEGHVLGVQVLEGLALFDNGEIAKTKAEVVYDRVAATTMQAIGYNFWIFEDGSTIVGRFQRLAVVDASGNVSYKTSTELIKGTGRYAGIKGSASSTGKNFPPGKDEAPKVFNDVTMTYTLPGK